MGALVLLVIMSGTDDERNAQKTAGEKNAEQETRDDEQKDGRGIRK